MEIKNKNSQFPHFSWDRLLSNSNEDYHDSNGSAQNRCLLHKDANQQRTESVSQKAQGKKGKQDRLDLGANALKKLHPHCDPK